MQRSINVIDMYHGNRVANPDFAGLRQNGVHAIIHKASQGSNYRDPAYAGRRVAATKAGLLWGAYHFLDGSDAKTQAEFFIKCSGITEENSDPILLACDFEVYSQHQATLQQCMTFMREVDGIAPGVQCVLYSGNLIRETLKPHPGGFISPDMAGAAAFFQQRRLWLAEYGPREQVPWPWNEPLTKSSNEATPLAAPGVWLWQYTEAGRVNPLIGKTDGNFFNGTYDELKASWLA